jgi:ABC-type nitrate/sulfonate/bicarbonate transport system permease component
MSASDTSRSARRTSRAISLADATLTPWQVAIGRVGVVGALVGVWAVVASSGVAGPGTIPQPTDVADALWRMLGTSDLYHALGQTMGAWALGVLVTLALGVPLGVLLGRSSIVYTSTRGLFDFLRAVPPVALIPLAVLILGVSTRLKIVLIVEVCIWPVLLQTMYGVRSAEPQQLEVARSLRLGRAGTARWVLVPTALPFLGTALRLTAVLALLVTIGVELLGGVPGLGLQIFQFQTANAVADVYALVLLVALLGVTISRVFSSLERYVLRWHPSQRNT